MNVHDDAINVGAIVCLFTLFGGEWVVLLIYGLPKGRHTIGNKVVAHSLKVCYFFI